MLWRGDGTSSRPPATPPTRRRTSRRSSRWRASRDILWRGDSGSSRPPATPPTRRHTSRRSSRCRASRDILRRGGSRSSCPPAHVQQLTGINRRVAIRWIGRVRAGSAPRTSPVTRVTTRRLSLLYTLPRGGSSASRIPSRDRLLLCSYPRRQIRDVIPESASSVNSQRSTDADRPLDPAVPASSVCCVSLLHSAMIRWTATNTVHRTVHPDHRHSLSAAALCASSRCARDVRIRRGDCAPSISR